ncbi:MAG: hypothetical protein WKF64_02155 [Ilumatobacteraceae bacterium]
MFRDAVRSTARRVVYASGLNLVVITLRVSAPWGRCPIGVPINVRLHRKNDPTTTVARAPAPANEAVLAPKANDWPPHPNSPPKRGAGSGSG